MPQMSPLMWLPMFFFMLLAIQLFITILPISQSSPLSPNLKINTTPAVVSWLW